MIQHSEPLFSFLRDPGPPDNPPGDRYTGGIGRGLSCPNYPAEGHHDGHP